VSRRSEKEVSMIVAVDRMGGYANGRTIPWSFGADWKHFKKITKGNICIMGRGTYDDIAKRRKSSTPEFRVLLPGRDSYVVSRTRSEVQGAKVFESVGQIIDSLPDDKREIYILGGRQLWLQYLPHAKHIWMTIVPGMYKTNKKFPYELLTDYEIVEGHKEPTGLGEIMFVKYVRKVKYYTAQIPRNDVFQQFVQILKMSKRLIKEDRAGLVFVEAKKNELGFIRQTGGVVTMRKGLANEIE
jgi:dihydrofolate reductase